MIESGLDFATKEIENRRLVAGVDANVESFHCALDPECDILEDWTQPRRDGGPHDCERQAEMLLKIGADRGVPLVGGATQIGDRIEGIDIIEDDLFHFRRPAARFLHHHPVGGATEPPLDGRLDRRVPFAYDRLDPVVHLLSTPPECHCKQRSYLPESYLGQHGEIGRIGRCKVERADHLTIVPQWNYQQVSQSPGHNPPLHGRGSLQGRQILYYLDSTGEQCTIDDRAGDVRRFMQLGESRNTLGIGLRMIFENIENPNTLVVEDDNVGSSKQFANALLNLDESFESRACIAFDEAVFQAGKNFLIGDIDSTHESDTVELEGPIRYHLSPQFHAGNVLAQRTDLLFTEHREFCHQNRVYEAVVAIQAEISLEPRRGVEHGGNHRVVEIELQPVEVRRHGQIGFPYDLLFLRYGAEAERRLDGPLLDEHQRLQLRRGKKRLIRERHECRCEGGVPESRRHDDTQQTADDRHVLPHDPHIVHGPQQSRHRLHLPAHIGSRIRIDAVFGANKLLPEFKNGGEIKAPDERETTVCGRLEKSNVGSYVVASARVPVGGGVILYHDSSVLVCEHLTIVQQQAEGPRHPWGTRLHRREGAVT